MRQLEEIDAQDRQDGTPQSRRLRQIPPETGRFLAMLVAAAPQGTVVEIGTSAGYSTLWLALACQQPGKEIVTYEVDPHKVALARETFRMAGVQDLVELVGGDALHGLGALPEISFCFIDTEKDLYAPCYELAVPKLVSGGWLVADNAINHRESLELFLQRALSDERLDALVVPIGKGELVCRKL